MKSALRITATLALSAVLSLLTLEIAGTAGHTTTVRAGMVTTLSDIDWP
ncbi:hypothetical protein [Streptomyces fulvoviolaceus]|nr:hypothetical protein [Streptomyces fulvoviolaceus]MCT9081056.1 hypothetical protein [Streptomyces fulvoviolaceus]